ncbi:alternative ribosome rescue aminoacyl-tRNA hydrolase ArfB [Thioalkalivibrio sp.]|uniref:alternative ribosome rescue aminoacyl-tRNA hydrolase ArfB n=1 Tax=Thioalkalivibrio sp. TaxID=2093813 RepID=UPI0035628595
MSMIEIGAGLRIPEEALEFRYKRATGPGGQHVNRTESAVELRLRLETPGLLPPPMLERLRRIARRRISREGVLIIHAQRFRSQERNREDALARLADLLQEAAQPRAPRIATRPTRASRERRLARKKRLGERKRGRGRLRPTEDH